MSAKQPAIRRPGTLAHCGTEVPPITTSKPTMSLRRCTNAIIPSRAAAMTVKGFLPGIIGMLQSFDLTIAFYAGQAAFRLTPHQHEQNLSSAASKQPAARYKER